MTLTGIIDKFFFGFFGGLGWLVISTIWHKIL